MHRNHAVSCKMMLLLLLLLVTMTHMKVGLRGHIDVVQFFCISWSREDDGCSHCTIVANDDDHDGHDEAAARKIYDVKKTMKSTL